MPSVYNTIFGGNLVAPAIPTYLALNISANAILGWPLESNITSPAAAEIIDVTATIGGLTIQLSDARQISTGYCALFNNVGANAVTILDAQGNVLMTPASGQAWQIYLADNSTLQGTWRVFQYGAGVSNANAASLAGAGLIAITTTLNENIVVNAKNANYNFVTADRATCIEWTGGAGTGTLPVAGGVTAPSGWFVIAKNNGSGVWTISGQAGATIDGSATLVLNPEQSCYLLTDGVNWITLGLGQQLNSIFDFVSISLTGQASPFVLSGVNLNRISYKFTGVLTGNMVVQVPNTIQQYWVDNETTGAFSLTLATPSGGGALTTAVNQGTRNILYSDGTNVVPAVTFGSTGFINGSAAAPSLFFTASPHTGIYSPGADQFAVATASTQRGIADATGHWTLQSPDTSGAGTFTLVVNGPGPTGTALQVNQQTQSSTSPALEVFASGAGASSFISVCSQTAVVGTSDLSIFQLGTSNDASLLLRGASNLNIGTKGLTRAILTSTGLLNLQTPDSGMTLFINGASPTAAVIGFNNASNTGATGPVLTANKPGASTNIQAWIPVQVGGSLCWMPAWAN